MLRRVLVGTIALLAGSALAIAAPKDDVNAAAKKLADAGNYTWKQAPQNAGGGQGGQGGQADGQNGGRRRGRGGMMGGPMEGKTADGIMVLTMGQGDNAREIVKKGDKVLFKTADGWQTPEEMEQAAGNDQQGGRPNMARFMARMITNMKAPAEEAEQIASHINDLKKDGDAYTGDMTEEGAKSFMSFGGRGGQGQGPEISNAKGNAKFWVKDGVLTKFEYTVSGTMSFNGNDREINRTMVVDISDVGSTKIDVPDDAKKKLQ